MKFPCATVSSSWPQVLIFPQVFIISTWNSQLLSLTLAWSAQSSVKLSSRSHPLTFSILMPATILNVAPERQHLSETFYLPQDMSGAAQNPSEYFYALLLLGFNQMLGGREYPYLTPAIICISLSPSSLPFSGIRISFHFLSQLVVVSLCSFLFSLGYSLSPTLWQC